MRGTACKRLGNRWFNAFAKMERITSSWIRSLGLGKFQPAVISFKTKTFKRDTAERIIDFYSWHNRMIITFARPDGTAADQIDIEEIFGEIRRAATLTTVLGIVVVPVDKESSADIKNALFHGKIVVAVSPEKISQDAKTFSSQLRRQFKGQNITL